MILQGMEGGWVVIEASHTVSSGLDVTCHMLICMCIVSYIYLSFKITVNTQVEFSQLQIPHS